MCFKPPVNGSHIPRVCIYVIEEGLGGLCRVILHMNERHMAMTDNRRGRDDTTAEDKRESVGVKKEYIIVGILWDVDGIMQLTFIKVH